MHELVAEHPRFGYRRIRVLLLERGFKLGHVRMWRLWKREGFKVPQKQRKKRRLGDSANAADRRQAKFVNDVWAWDFVHDRDERDERGRPLKWLSAVDEHSRECVALEVGRSSKSGNVLDVLRNLLLVRGVPKHIRSDNGPEFMADAIRGFLKSAEVETLYVDPGSPWQNGYAESFHARLRDELLDAELFADLAEAEALSSRWRNDYNHRRPHSSLGYVAPATFASRQASAAVGAAPPPTPPPAETSPTLTSGGTRK